MTDPKVNWYDRVSSGMAIRRRFDIEKSAALQKRRLQRLLFMGHQPLRNRESVVQLFHFCYES